jgi:2-polyprenyl-3-methyl-5-hydroxy-6-metoxy-1,4-benzoquinol methylase
MSDYDPRIVELYDTDNGDGADHDYYRRLAESVRAESVLDLGCGTGLLTVSLATAGRTVVGIDPSLTMIRYARSRPGGRQVR